MPRTRARVAIRDTDKGYRELVKTLTRLGGAGTGVKVGVFGRKDMRGDELGNVALAMIHEFGTRTVPERSFLRSTFDANRGKYVELLVQLLADHVVTGKRSEEWALAMIGERIASDVKNRIAEGAGIPPPLAEATIAAKGSDRPLVDTGRLLGSISYEVSVGGKTKEGA